MKYAYTAIRAEMGLVPGTGIGHAHTLFERSADQAK